MKQYEFIGDPGNYNWDFKLKKNNVYKGSIIAFRRHTIEELINSETDPQDPEFNKEWNEYKPK